MPTWLLIVILVLAVLAVGGFLARRALTRRTETQFRARLEQANHDLAEAAAEDRGWDRPKLEAAARRIYAEQRGAEPAELLLTEVLDRPGTEEDIAVFTVEGEGRRETLTLGRRDGEWIHESLA
jgi:hypothetical protein